MLLVIVLYYWLVGALRTEKKNTKDAFVIIFRATKGLKRGEPHRHPIKGGGAAGDRPQVSSAEYLHSLVGGGGALDALDIEMVLYGYEVLCPAGPHRTLSGRIHRTGDNG